MDIIRIRIRIRIFPIHLSHKDFIVRYKCLIKNKSFEYPQKYLTNILEKNGMPTTEWQIGKSKIFLRNAAYELLETNRKDTLYKNAVIIQKNWKKYYIQKSFLRNKQAVLRIQHAYRGWRLRIRFMRMRRSAIVIQSRLRGVFAREVRLFIIHISYLLNQKKLFINNLKCRELASHIFKSFGKQKTHLVFNPIVERSRPHFTTLFSKFETCLI